MARNCLVDSKLFQTKRSGRINLRTTLDLGKELGISRKEYKKNYGRYAGCVALQVLHQEQSRKNMMEPILLIGGQPSRNPYAADSTQVIRYIDKNIAQIGNVAMMILQRLIEASPVGPFKPERRGDGQANPHYWECHILMVNGRQIMPTDENIKPTDTIQIVNTRIYAKRIEQGWSMQAPSGVYKGVSRWAKRVFGDSFTIRWGYKSLTNVPQDSVRRYNFPKVRPGMPTSMFTGGRDMGVGTFAKKGAFNFVTNHKGAAASFGFKNVAAIFPYMELKPKQLAASVGQTAGKAVKMRSIKL